MKKRILVAATLALCACQTAAPSYRAASGPGSAGYFTAPAESGRYTVVYTGDKGMTPTQVAELALLSAAELAIASGQEWFAVINAATRQVQLGDVNSIQGRTGSVLTSQSTTAGAGGGGDMSSAAPGVKDSVVPGGPSIGGFGGGDVPYQVIEKWTPRTVYQTAMLIQLGSGNKASFEGLDKAPEIYSARAVADEIRGRRER